MERPILRVRTDNRDDHNHLREIGQAFADLLNEVARSQGAETDVATFTGVIRRSCDGCTATATGMERPEGWTEHVGGLDYCPHCSSCSALREPEQQSLGGHHAVSHPEATTSVPTARGGDLPSVPR